ncbi:abortive infection system antitoxin AbiGi family protein [Algibacter lectus]|uniref:Abortive phage resistance protein AbiGi (Putative antitoxin) n=1 Tax=Algibacter lectus TaxID=221126 RepID=A0A4V3HHD8_9FLAO|nr:abortive infection system antitoxin AbiGi family protein [Algibacter lectus]MWW24758.1 hypothetical protein [Algibacter lectus]TDY64831.1 abortive phage resistance protein AbiGi (putative antitoxin) [Algibacter lectus]
MASKKKINIEKNQFNQKKINHIFHYTNNFEVILKILNNGFIPSYCEEKINDIEYYIPMVSFCNIPLRDVDLYMRYGKHGIGMSLNWALKNSISPVIYIHENTPFRDFNKNINLIFLNNMMKQLFNNQPFSNLENNFNENIEGHTENSKKISTVNISLIQFFKNWKTYYKENEIITYQEREWRFIPELENEKKIFNKYDNEFNQIKNNEFREKPHLPKYSVKLNDINDIRYIIINNENQRNILLNVLNKKFGSDKVIDSILSGNLMIINDKFIHDDF